MAKPVKGGGRDDVMAGMPDCCRVEAVIPVDGRGQMVLPKNVRERAGIRAGDKLAMITWQTSEKGCCICLFKAEELTQMVKRLLGPLAK